MAHGFPLTDDCPADYSDEDVDQNGPNMAQPSSQAWARERPPLPSGAPTGRRPRTPGPSSKTRRAPPVPPKRDTRSRSPAMKFADHQHAFLETYHQPQLPMHTIPEKGRIDYRENEYGIDTRNPLHDTRSSRIRVLPDPMEIVSGLDTSQRPSHSPQFPRTKVLPDPREAIPMKRTYQADLYDDSAVVANTDRTTGHSHGVVAETHGVPHQQIDGSHDGNSAEKEEGRISLDDVTVYRNEDLTDLEYLDNDILLEHLRSRFDHQQPYTYLGDSLVAVNPCKALDIYTEEYHKKYKNLRVRCHEPAHIFWVASHVHSNLMLTGSSQCVVVGGDSGAGKTESIKYILHHLVHQGVVSKGSPHTATTPSLHPSPDIVSKLEKINPLLELFGNACTVLNENSSRFGKLVELEYDSLGTLITARLECFILEKFRVTSRNPMERNFHVLYALFAGLSAQRLAELGLDMSAESYRILKPWESTDGVFRTEEELERYTAQCAHLNSSLPDVGFTPFETSSLFNILAAILLLSNVEFEHRDPDLADELVLDGMGQVCLGRAVEVLGLQEEAELLEDSLLRVNMEIKGEKMVRQKTLRQARDGRDALARELYAVLFYGVIDRINHNLSGDITSDHTSSSRHACIRLLDISGFENVAQHNGFEQFVINSTNEKLQQFFLNHTFHQESIDYQREGLQDIKVDFTDNTHIVNLIFAKPEGLIPLLEDEIATNGSDQGWLTKCSGRSHASPHFTAQADTAFLLSHYAGSVKYSAKGFVTKNSDTLPHDLREVVQQSDNSFIRDYFVIGSDAAALMHKSGRASFGKSRNGRRRQGVSISFDGKETGQGRRTGKLSGRFTDQYQKSLSGMMAKLQTATPVFVRCIKPNLQLMPKTFDPKVVREQLLSSGLQEVAKVRKEGYPIRIKFAHFVSRYKHLHDIADDVDTPKTAEQLRHMCELLLSSACVKGHQFGHNKVFLKIKHREQVDQALDLKKREREERARLEKERQIREKAIRDARERGEDDISSISQEPLSAATFHGLSSESGIDSARSQSEGDPKDTVDKAEEEVKKQKEEEEEAEEAERKKKQEKKKKEGLGNQPAYDIFRVTERDFENSTELEMKIRRCVRLVMYVVIFCLVMGGAMLSRVAIVWLTSDQLKNQAVSELTPLLEGVKHAETVSEFRKGLGPTRLLLCQLVPLQLAWLACLGKVLFGRKDWPGMKALLLVTGLDTAGVVGRCVFLFKLLPSVDFVTGFVLGNAVCQIPGLLKLASLVLLPMNNTSYSFYDVRKRRWARVKRYLYVAAVGLALLVQLAVVPLLYCSDSILSAVTDTSQSMRLPELWVLLVSTLFSSLGWWENYAYGRTGNGKQGKDHHHLPLMALSRWRVEMARIRQTSFVYTGPVQMIVMVGLFFSFNSESIDLSQQISVLFDSLGRGFGDSKVLDSHMIAYSLMYMQIAGTLVSSYLSSLACRLYMQEMAFALPIMLVAPACIVINLRCVPSDLVHWYRISNSCITKDLSDAPVAFVVIVGVLVWMSVLIINNHLWFPQVERTAKLERLFTFPHRDPVFADTSLQCSRRQDRLENAERKRRHKKSDGKSKEGVERPTVYICATMWHEIRQEMLQLLKSLFRIDFDVYTRKKAVSQFDLLEEHSDLYDPEIHIIFDDAFETDEKSKQRVINSWVRQFLEVMPDAMASVAKRNIELQAPTKIPTPYGGRMEWMLPGGTKMQVHLKDKNLIRHRKRWSQVLYLYYLLGHRLMADYKTVDDALGAGENVRKRRRRPHRIRKNTSLLNNLSPSKVRQADNIFIMTLDGDVDFRPDSVRLLLDRMKKNKQVAAVCGRIHPIGDGPMIWYQKFEYAVGHWLQKAAEHVFGCVLCCPGCFSLFRGSSLMDDNVMKMYTTEPTEASHFIQYEQGEDRWLCTLLLQQGWRIEYCAGADALTFAPETFHDFYIQRRRWSPSTMANIIDLVSSWRITVKMNDNISIIFMFYQFVLMVASIFAPGLVVYMISGAYNAVLGLGLWESYLLSVVPVCLYVALCLRAKTQTQINVAAIMSSVYTIVMLLVTIGTIINVATANILAPDVLFLICVAVIFVLAGLLHPQELFCLFHGVLYYVTVPSSFVFLTVFFVCNLNVVTWGTREGPNKVDPTTEQSPVQERGKLYKFFEKLGITAIAQDLKTFVRQMMGIKHEITGNQENQQDVPAVVSVTKPEQQTPSVRIPPPVPPKPKPESKILPDATYWTRDLDLPNSTVGQISEDETNFWRFLIEEYLHPIKANKKQQDKISADLKSARNNVVFGYMLLNLMFTLVLLQLKLQMDKLKDTFYIASKYEPVSTVSLAIFSSLLITQFLGMLGHRWGTFIHLIASTRITWFRRNEEEERAMTAIQEAQKLTAANTEGDIDFINPDYSDADDTADDDTISPSNVSVSPNMSANDLHTMGQDPKEAEPDYSNSEEDEVEVETEFGDPMSVQYDSVFDRRFRSVRKHIERQNRPARTPLYQKNAAVGSGTRHYPRPRNVRQYERRQNLYFSNQRQPWERRNSIFDV